MTKICLCLNAKTIAADLKMLEKYRKYIDIAELRADCLLSDELESIRRFPALAGLPVILTVRRKQDGGMFTRGEAARIVLISKALAFANPDFRQNFAYLDLEEDVDIPSLEEVARVFGTRIIRSFHDFTSTSGNLTERIKKLFRTGDEIAKAAVMPQNADDVCAVLRSAKELRGTDSIIIAMGDIGQCTRILAAKFGGYLTYVSGRAEDGVLTAAPGQLDPVELTELYHFREINADTAVYGLTGYPLKTTLSPEFHNEVFERERINAVYLRLPSETAGGFMQLAAELDLRGASVTVPHKESIIPFLDTISNEAAFTGACNTIIRKNAAWNGYNTDAPGFSDSLLNLMGRKHLKRLKATLIGAGGASRAVAAELSRLGAKVLVLNRNVRRAQELAAKHKFYFGSLEDEDGSRVRKFADIIVQTTSVGMAPDINKDPFPQYQFTGREVVVDIIYKPEETTFLARARKAGCMTLNGYDMLLRQAKYQYTCFFGKDYPEGSAKR